MEAPSSRQLIARCVDGDQDAQTQIVERYQTRLLKMARQANAGRKQLVEPDSIVAEVFVRFLNLARSGRLEWQFEGGLWRLLSHMTALRLKEKNREIRDPRKTARGGSALLDEQESVSHARYDHALAESMEEFRGLLGDYRSSLSEARLPVFDSWLEGKSSLEIGKAVSMTDRHVRRLLNQFREDLSQRMNTRIA
ncbi:MAG: RNA polymerase sigma factor [Planctomycetales bacterium]|jgi:DNA-directed RNA polymerase specialized sigma24 family protein